MPISSLQRQLLIAGSSQLAAFAVGGAVTYPGVLLHQFRANDSIIQLNLDTASWIGSIHGLAGIPSIFMPSIMQWKGRKLAFIAACFISIIGWIINYTASSASVIFVSECFQGLGNHCIMAVGLLSISEMVAPRYRNTCTVTFYIVQTLGMNFVGVLGKYVHWKMISVIMCIPLLIAFLIACTWPESPYWLAYKGQFDKCEEAFLWLRGVDDESQQELSKLMASSKNNQTLVENTNNFNLKNFLKKLRRRDFYLPCFFMFVLLDCVYWSGLLVHMIYFSELFHRTTKNEDIVAMGSVITNVIFCLGAIGVNILIRFLNNKTVILLNAGLIIIFAVIGSIVTFLLSNGVFGIESLVPSICIILFMIALSIATANFTVAAELMPVKHRGFGGAFYIIVTCFLHSSSLKLAPYLFFHLDIWGTYIIFAINAIVCGFIIWRYVPETKGRTLQEIEDFYNNGRFENRRNVDAPLMK